MRYFLADLHIHSVLSPCGGLEMSPRAVVDRLVSLGINWMAITDHNSLANCPAYASVAHSAGMNFTWGVEMQTQEEIHLLVYFDAAGSAREFGKALYDSLLPINNDPDFFGDQVIIDENENITGMEQKALVNSSVWDLATAVSMARGFEGYCVPAHIDASANSILGQLGFLPDDPKFDLLGITAGLDAAAYRAEHPELANKAFLRCSDAHYLCDLGSGFSKVHVNSATVAELALAAGGVDSRSILV
jgi:PHP family Zn ribbon phosphoesterase